MMIMILDQGVGIPNTLDANLLDLIAAALGDFKLRPTDGYMIKAATELHRTSTSQATRGRGFRDMKRFVDTCDDGELRVMSNRGTYAYVKGQETIDDHDASIGGTLIEWRVRHAAMVEVGHV
jgi:hypothetical protein